MTEKIPNRREFLKAAGFAGVSLVTTGLEQHSFAKGSSSVKRRPNIVWIMMDDGRADTLGCYGKPWAKTPHIDAVAKRGLRFSTAIVQNPVCVPSRSSMLTSQYPHTLGLMNMGPPAEVPPLYLSRIKQQFPNLLNRWKKVGINPINIGKCHAYAADWDHRGEPGDLRETKQNRTTSSLPTYPEVKTKTHGWRIGGTIPLKPEAIRTSRIGDLAVKTLKELLTDDKPFFLRVSFHAPHVPCRVSPEYMIDPEKIDLRLPTDEELKSKPRFERECLRIYAGGLDLNKKQIGIARGTYYGMVWLVDTQVGRIVEELKRAGVLNNTIIAINSDQGFQLGEHGLWKKEVLYEENVRVPLVLSCPDLLPAGKVIDEPVELVDFMPTLLELSGLDVPDGIAGRSLMPLVRGEVKRWRPACFCEHDHACSTLEELRNTGRRVMARTKKWKMIWFMDSRVANKDGALYNLEDDPGETVNLYGKPKYEPVIKRLEALARKWAEHR